MSFPGSPSLDPRSNGGAEERIEVRRYLSAIQRNARLIAAIVIVVTGAVIALSLMAQPSYQARADIVLEESTSSLGGSDAAATERKLATAARLLTSRRILDDAGRTLGESGRSLQGKVRPSIDARANIVSVVGVAGSAPKAAAIANAVADAFLADRVELVGKQIADARRRVEQRINELSSGPQDKPELVALRQRLANLGVAESAVGIDLQIAERAEPPGRASSPRPRRNAILALFASLFLGILVALGRDQLAPRAGGARELSQVVGLPVLANIPRVRRRWRRRRDFLLGEVEDEAYQALRTTLEFSALDDDGRVVLLVTSALAGEGKTTATAQLGRALARGGHRTLLISADLRVPTLHEHFDLDADHVGLAQLLTAFDRRGRGDSNHELLDRAIRPVMSSTGGSGCLHVITSGARVQDPGRLVSGPAMRDFLAEVRRLDYDYVVVDSPPLLGLPDSQALAQWTDAILVTTWLDKMTLDRAGDLRSLLERLEAHALGLVVIGGAQGKISPYYLVGRQPVTSGEP
ncbi:MAG: Wzz/FepE/Etk N-terminal domain-containing protein [Solirubrobacteraceae bacterium]